MYFSGVPIVKTMIAFPFLSIALVIITLMQPLTSISQQNNDNSQRPNIVFIMSDDHAYQAISAYGYGLNETPNIDRIAREGALFTRAFVTNSICAPSRAVILTGKFSHINGKIDNANKFDWNQDNFAKQLKANFTEIRCLTLKFSE